MVSYGSTLKFAERSRSHSQSAIAWSNSYASRMLSNLPRTSITQYTHSTMNHLSTKCSFYFYYLMLDRLVWLLQANNRPRKCPYWGFRCKLQIHPLERFSNNCRKIKSEVITSTNHNRSEQRDQPIRIP